MIGWGNLAGMWLILPMAVGGFLVTVLNLRRAKLRRLLAGGNRENLSKSERYLFLRSWLLCAGLVSLLIAFLSPQWGESEQLIPQAGRDIVVAIDVSKSMLAQDFKPNRFEFSKAKIKKLVKSLAGDRIGLILFAADAVVICPITRDQDLLTAFLEDATVQTLSGGTTNLARAIEVAVKMMERVEGAKTKLLAIFTDGEDFSQGLEASGKLAHEAGVRILTFGVATSQGAPIPQFDLQGQSDGFVTDQDGSVVISRLNQSLLQDVANRCGGKYLAADANEDQDLSQAVAWVESFERHGVSDKILHLKAEKYYYFGLLAFILLMIEWLL